MELELDRLELRFADLRVIQPKKVSNLVESINENGQLTAVVVADASGIKPILLDGYARVAALRVLKRDMVLAQPTLETIEQALVSRLRGLSTSPSSAMEQGWILSELRGNKVSLSQLAIRLGRSTSWVSRRLALVESTPEAVQQGVRTGKLCPYGAMRYLVPLARANIDHCNILVRNLGNIPISSRKLGQLYEGYRKADAIGKQRVLNEPLLYLQVATRRQELTGMTEQDQLVLDGLARMARIISVVHGKISLWGQDRWNQTLRSCWTRVDDGFVSLRTTVQEQMDVGSRYADSNSGTKEQGTRRTLDCQEPTSLSQSS